jgi:hypothetical protein
MSGTRQKLEIDDIGSTIPLPDVNIPMPPGAAIPDNPAPNPLAIPNLPSPSDPDEV